MRKGLLRALESTRIGIGRQEDHGQAVLLVDVPRCLDAVHFSFEVDVHQHQVGSMCLEVIQRRLRAGENSVHVIARLRQHHGDMRADDHVVFDDEDGEGG